MPQGKGQSPANSDINPSDQQWGAYRTDGPNQIENQMNKPDRIIGTPIAGTPSPGSMVSDGDMGAPPGRVQTTEAGPSREDSARNPAIKHTLR